MPNALLFKQPPAQLQAQHAGRLRPRRLAPPQCATAVHAQHASSLTNVTPHCTPDRQLEPCNNCVRACSASGGSSRGGRSAAQARSRKHTSRGWMAHAGLPRDPFLPAAPARSPAPRATSRAAARCTSRSLGNGPGGPAGAGARPPTSASRPEMPPSASAPPWADHAAPAARRWARRSRLAPPCPSRASA